MIKSIPAIILLLLINAATFAGESTVLKPKPGDKCPVCGMFVAKYPDFLARISFRDGSSFYFDGAKDMFKCILNMQRYLPSKNKSDIAAVSVTDYYGLSSIDAKKALYVIGSDVYGPMGRELIPFRNATEAQEFVRDHRGKRIVQFGDVTAEMLREMD